MERQILDLFLYNNKLKFNQIEKSLRIRSNKLAYYLTNLIKRKMLIKNNDFYELASDFEYLIPYISKKSPVLSILVIQIRNGKQVFLYPRKKRPFKDIFSLPGGRLILGENINQAVSRIMTEKFGIQARLDKINSVSLEHVKKGKRVIHSFLLIFVNAVTKDKLELTNFAKNKSKIISSDYLLITKHSKSSININILETKT